MTKPISKYPEPPCKKKKCIAYPACISKTHIHCDDLFQYRSRLMMNRRLYTEPSIWFKIKKTIPKIVEISRTIQTVEAGTGRVVNYRQHVNINERQG